jgi:hypothetical protein
MTLILFPRSSLLVAKSYNARCERGFDCIMPLGWDDHTTESGNVGELGIIHGTGTPIKICWSE